ncbi:MAG TPA: hypothetical protein VLA25_02450, partial [Methylotenera sp.]|nr:hypothetical protein [Methylotenera sp.]
QTRCMNNQPVYIGVDPAFRSGGFWACILDMTDKTAAFKCFADVLEYHDWLRSLEAPISCFVCVENSNLQNKTFAYAQKGERAEIMRKSRNIGANQAVSQLAFDSALRRYGKDRVFQVSPESKGGKWTEKQSGCVLKSERLTVITNGNNQDARDALKLALIAVRMALINGKFK